MAFSTFQLLYMTLIINKMDGCGLSNTTCCEPLPKKSKGDMILATEGLLDGSNKIKHFSYKGEWPMCSDAFKRRLASASQ